MAKTTYEFLFGNRPMHPTYVHMQMADQTYRIPEGIAKYVMVEIRGHYVPTDFLVLDMGAEDYDPPLILGRPFLNTTNAVIHVRNGEVHFWISGQKIRCYFNSYT